MTKEKTRWVEEKKELKQKSVSELQDILKDLHLEKLKMEVDARSHHLNRQVSQRDHPVNLKNIRHKIAFVNQLIHLKTIKR